MNKTNSSGAKEEAERVMRVVAGWGNIRVFSMGVILKMEMEARGELNA